jgi:hypothetical protein
MIARVTVFTAWTLLCVGRVELLRYAHFGGMTYGW